MNLALQYQTVFFDDGPLKECFGRFRSFRTDDSLHRVSLDRLKTEFGGVQRAGFSILIFLLMSVRYPVERRSTVNTCSDGWCFTVDRLETKHDHEFYFERP